jgi:transposase
VLPSCLAWLNHAHLSDFDLRQIDGEYLRSLSPEQLRVVTEIFQVLAHPELPLTNNEGERALRHWVIARKLSFGTRTAEGSRAYGLLASVIDNGSGHPSLVLFSQRV